MLKTGTCLTSTLLICLFNITLVSILYLQICFSPTPCLLHTPLLRCRRLRLLGRSLIPHLSILSFIIILFIPRPLSSWCISFSVSLCNTVSYRRQGVRPQTAGSLTSNPSCSCMECVRRLKTAIKYSMSINVL